MSTNTRVCAALLAVVMGAGVTACAESAASERHAAPYGPAATQQVLDGFVRDGVPGTMTYVRDGAGSWTRSAGTGRRGAVDPIGPQDRVRVASNTKMYVATVVLQLVAERKLRLDDPVENHLPGLIDGNGYDGRAITVRQLLQHTSGLADYVDDVIDPDAERAWSVTDLVRVGLRHRPVFAPGTGWSYSNTNYLVLGLIVQRVTGHPLGAEITDRIIRPLGLHATSYPAAGDRHIPGPHPRGYYGGDGTPSRDVTGTEPSIAGPSGALISSGPDMTTFVRALQDGRLLPPAQQAEMRRTVATDDGDRYGLGLREFRLPCGGVAWGHDGNILGFDSVVAATDGGRSVFVVANGRQRDGSVADLRSAAGTALC